MIKVSSCQDWNFEQIEKIYEEISKIAIEKFHLNVYPNQLEIITAEQMLDSYCSVGMPIYYPHWSFGEQFVKEKEMYIRGKMGLAYEIVINSDPCISYLMEENSLLMQTLVIAHAAFGHNHFFKNNYMFKQWTEADGIIDYLSFAKKYITECEELYGTEAVEEVLDAAHALQIYGIDKYKRPQKLSLAQAADREREREEYNQSQLNLVWNTIPQKQKEDTEKDERFPQSPQENLLYFIEKNAPALDEWKRECIRIVRTISQYFYPQRQTQLMNEGCATYFHYNIMQELHKKGIVDAGAMLEFYTSHSGVIYQSELFLDSGERNPYYSGGFNVYALGFAMYKDIERVATNPTKEDREWFKGQKWVGCGDGIKTILWAIENFKDESFVKQFLSPKVMRDFEMLVIHDDERDPKMEVTAIQNERGYKLIRDKLSEQYNFGYSTPDIQVYDVDQWGDRSLTLRHYRVNDKPLDDVAAIETLKHLEFLWGYGVKLESVAESGDIRSSIILGDETTIDVFLDD